MPPKSSRREEILHSSLPGFRQPFGTLQSLGSCVWQYLLARFYGKAFENERNRKLDKRSDQSRARSSGGIEPSYRKRSHCLFQTAIVITYWNVSLSQMRWASKRVSREQPYPASCRVEVLNAWRALRNRWLEKGDIDGTGSKLFRKIIPVYLYPCYVVQKPRQGLSCRENPTSSHIWWES